jgi:hypothetical protein
MPKPKQGMPIWAKIGLGCGIVFLLLVLTCGSCVWLGISKGSAALDRSWAELHASAEGLRTEEGARALYREHPRLKESYPSEEEFLTVAAEWRPNLSGLPAKRPDFKALFQEHKLEIQASNQNGRETTHIRYHMESGKALVMDTEMGKLVDIRVE